MTLPDRDTIQTLWKVKKLIREEFDANIQINQPDLDTVLQEYVKRTKKPALKALLSQLLPQEQAAQEILTTNSETQENVKKTTRKIIYRGQIVKQEESA